MKKFLFVLVSCFFMLSCKKDDIKVYEFSKLFTALDTVDLETKEESIITSVTSLQTFNGNKWYVSEHYSLFLFDGEGKYLKKNGQRGNGPKEYSCHGLTVNGLLDNTTFLYLQALLHKDNILRVVCQDYT
jgi:hypothetical protein